MHFVQKNKHWEKSPSNKTGTNRQRAGAGDICLYGVIKGVIKGTIEQSIKLQWAQIIRANVPQMIEIKNWV